ncbi:MAG: protein kinase [Myxococcales bacterium]|nr:protein kinase [Myxococcales bacterium]
MGEVYRCHDYVADQSVALKRLRADAAEERPAIAALFEREYHALRELAHPSIIQVFDYGISPDGGPYYTMELLDGQDLRALAPIAWRQACGLLRDIASSLAIMHSRRLLHRDISPGNVHKDGGGRAKLLDFGAMGTFGVNAQIVGTPPCIPPEMLHNQPLDARADLYSLGALGYYLISGRHAYPARRIDALRDFWRSRPRSLTKEAPDIPQELCTLLTSMISLDPMARPTSAGEVIERLTAIAGLETDECLDETIEVAHAYLKTPTMLGRHVPLVRLRKQVLRARRGRGSASIIEGEPGIGRTRLLDALELEGKLGGATVIRAGAAESARRPYGLIGELVQSLAAQLPGLARSHLEPHRQALAPVLGRLLEQLSMSPLAEASVLRRHEDVDSVAMAALADYLDGITNERCLVIAVDDLQDTDEQSQGILSALAHRARSRRLAIVVTITAGQPEGSLVTGLRRVAPPIRLTPLGAEDVRKLVCSLFGDVPHVGLVAEWVDRLAQGRPRNCMELCEHLVEHGIARYRRGVWNLPASLQEDKLPKSFEDALLARVRQLDPDAIAIAHGVALSTLRLALHEYERLLAGEGDRHARAFAAIGELVAVGILVGEGDAYRLSQPAYADAIRATLDESGARQAHRRLARIFESREAAYNVAEHLLLAGEELPALAAVVAGYERATALQTASSSYSMGTFGEDIILALETRRRLLDVWVQHDRPERERYVLYRSIVMLGLYRDASLTRPYIEPLMEMLKQAIGLQYWDELGEQASSAERIRHCLAKAKQDHEQADEHERVLPPRDAVMSAIVLIGICQNIARGDYDAPLLRYLLGFAEQLVALFPRLRISRAAVEHSLALVTGRVSVAHGIRQRMFEYYETEALPRQDNPLYYVSQIGRAIILHAEGYFWAVRGGTRAEAFAALLEDPLQGLPEEGNALKSSGHIWLRRAWEVRYIMHLCNGNAKEARRTQDRIDQLAMQRRWASFGGGTAQFEALAHASCGDLMALKQSLQTLEAIVEGGQQGWRPFLHVAKGQYQALRGDHASAMAEYQRALDLTDAGEHAAWLVASSCIVEALLALGHMDEALDRARQALAQCKRIDLGPSAEHGLKCVLSLAEAATGSGETALRRLERLRAAAEAGGVDGAAMGHLDEIIARACLYAQDHEGFCAAAARVGEKYRAGGNPALFAKHERLLQAGRAAGVSSDSMRPARNVPVVSIDPTGVQTELAATNDQEERHLVALRVMLQRSRARSGFLFLWENDALRLAAADDPNEPSKELLHSLTEYLKAELDDYPEVTVTCLDQHLADGEDPGFAVADGQYRPVLLTCNTDGLPEVVGIAALFDSGAGFHTPSRDVICAVAEGLSFTQDGDQKVSVFELG